MDYEEYISNLQSSVSDMDKRLENLWELVDGERQNDLEFKRQVEEAQLARDTLESATNTMMDNQPDWEQYRENVDSAFQAYEGSLNGFD